MFYNPFTVKGFAKGLAQAQLKSLHAMQRRFPQLSKLELYTLALSTRPGYTEQQIVAIITEIIDKIVTHRWAQGYTEATRESVTKRDLDFRFVVLALANDEFKKTLGREPSNEQLAALSAGVEAVIPSSI